jgi:hypothetical protein
MDRDTNKESIAHSERNFCSKCSSMLWIYIEKWCIDVQLPIIAERFLNTLYRPELIHPFASAIDSELVEPEEMVSNSIYQNNQLILTITQVIVKTNSKPDYVRLPEGKKKVYKNYGPSSIEEWHKKHDLWVE